MSSYSCLSGFSDNLNSTRAMRLEDACWRWSEKLGFNQIRLPLIEERTLFERAVGTSTDVVEKEMFSVNDDQVLRPEGTAQAMRAWLNAGGQRKGPVRWAYCGPMFRNERPQAGRYKQFNQFGCEAIMVNESAFDADILINMAELFSTLAVRDKLVLRINTLGTMAERMRYRDDLLQWLLPQKDNLDEVSQRRLFSNPLRIWDSKDSRTKELMATGPCLLDYLGSESLQAWRRLTTALDVAGVNYVVEPGLMRGLDYYNGLVFEWTTFEDKAQNTVAAGGRYDGLAKLLGGVQAPAFGFAIGLERLALLLDKESETVETEREGYFMASLSDVDTYALQVALLYRRAGEKVFMGDDMTKLAKQLQRADASNARYALIVGDTEAKNKTVTVKDLLTGIQTTFAVPF